jgi:hypothetical protein
MAQRDASDIGRIGFIGHERELLDLLKQSRVQKLILFVNYGGIETEKVKASLELFSKEVMPSFAD